MSKYESKICMYCEKRSATPTDDAECGRMIDAGVRIADVAAMWAIELQAQNRQLRAEVERLRAALEAVEWVTRNGQKSCPWCWHDISVRPHAPTCQRQIALGIAQEVNK